MPREYARRSLKTWSDKDFCALDLAHQGLYDALNAYPKLLWCGVVNYLPKQLCRCSDGLTPAQLVRMVNHLVSRDYLRVDLDTDELLIRTFVRHDGVMHMLNMGKTMARDYEKVISPYLRSVIVAELAKLRADKPTLKGWAGVAAVNPELFDEVCDRGSTSPLFTPDAKG